MCDSELVYWGVLIRVAHRWRAEAPLPRRSLEETPPDPVRATPPSEELSYNLPVTSHNSLKGREGEKQTFRNSQS